MFENGLGIVLLTGAALLIMCLYGEKRQRRFARQRAMLVPIPLADVKNHATVEQYIDNVSVGRWRLTDGRAYWATFTQVSGLDTVKDCRPGWATHVVWRPWAVG